MMNRSLRLSMLKNSNDLKRLQMGFRGFIAQKL